MTDQEILDAVFERVPGRTFAALKERLGLSGSGAESCSDDAKRGGQDGAEGRSREGGRVPPGEAARYLAIQTAISEVCQIIREKGFIGETRKTYETELSRLVSMLDAQPDSEAKRSGRRNAGVLAQPTNDSTDTKNGQ